MTGPSEVDHVVLAGEPGSAQQLEHGDDDLPVLGQDPDDEGAADAQPTGFGESSGPPDEDPPVSPPPARGRAGTVRRREQTPDRTLAVD